MNNNYYDVALSDLNYLELTLGIPGFNQISVQCQQIVEKLLKSVVEIVCTSDIEELLKTHNLRKIYMAVDKEKKSFKLDAKDLGYLKDFYFDAKYPGDNFVWVTKEECAECLHIMYEVLFEVNKLRTELSLPVEFKDEKYLTC